MPEYRVIAEMSCLLTTTIEAKDEFEALELAKDVDGGEFEEIENSGDWELLRADRVK